MLGKHLLQYLLEDEEARALLQCLLEDEEARALLQCLLQFLLQGEARGSLGKARGTLGATARSCMASSPGQHLNNSLWHSWIMPKTALHLPTQIVLHLHPAPGGIGSS